MNLPILAHFSVHEAETPSFSVEKSSLFGRNYYVAAKWEDGFRVKIADFCEKSVAQYWIEVESMRWTAALRQRAKIAA
jgi:hypothetical protein